MNTKTIQSINKQMYKRFPELLGSQPKIQAQKRLNDQPDPATYVLTYHTQVIAANGKTIQRAVRVVTSQEGKILKVTTSR
jgi:hypothetical protein